ncbi:MAG: polysaccharide biosynthesis protein [Prevotella sp.]|nr:polysaccharide biosynthesis protein [Prevotella sp.]
MKNRLYFYLAWNVVPGWVVLLIDCLILFCSGVFAFWMFESSADLTIYAKELLCTLLVIICIGLVGFGWFHTYSGMMRYSSFGDLLRVANGNVTSLVLTVAVMYLLKQQDIRTLSVMTYVEIVVAFFIATMLMWIERVVVKVIFEVTTSSAHALNVLIYGAMSGGAGLAKNIRSQSPKKYILRGFISPDKRAGKFRLMGQKVYSVDDDLKAIIRKKGIQGVLVSPLRIDDFRRNQKIQDLLISENVKILLAQNDKEVDVKDGHVKEEDFSNVMLKEVSVEDLLPRDEIVVDMEGVRGVLQGKCVMVTGSAGSIGSELVRQIAKFEPSEMLLVDQAETPSHDIRLMMAREYPQVKAETIVTSICNVARMEQLFRDRRIDVVFHAAAYKHVPMMEDNPAEAINNNVYGTKVIADLAVKYGVKKFVMISTDKAVNPTNVMGCSKRICEIYVQSLNRAQDVCQFVTTRFGNVLGSSGSVIPLFEKQIKNGGPITVTDERIVRYFMLIPEACKLVLEAATHGHGGEIFAFDMGEPVKIADLARRMILLSNATNVKIKFVGLRPGEKLYEEVLNNEENTIPSFHEKIRIAIVREYDFDKVSKEIDDLITTAKTADDMTIVKLMKDLVPEYKSENSKYKELDTLPGDRSLA